MSSLPRLCRKKAKIKKIRVFLFQVFVTLGFIFSFKQGGPDQAYALIVRTLFLGFIINGTIVYDHSRIKTCSQSLVFPANLRISLTPVISISPRSRKGFPNINCTLGAKKSHSHKIRCNVSSSIPNFLHFGESITPISCRRLERFLSQITTTITIQVHPGATF